MANDDLKLKSGKSGMPQPRRVVTAPVDLPSPAPNSTLPSSTSTSASASSSRSEDLVETLYSHPSVRIIAFTSAQRTSLGPRPSSADADRPGTLPASSRLERTLAVGPFRIYRAPGSVAFLSCGSALQPILPKSQCWCIDEENSRFVLQIRRPQYWRIELPVTEPDDKDRALLLREVLDKALLFEKTECPFQRSFTVELPEQLTPVKKKAWTPDGKNLISDPFSPIVSPSPRGFANDRRASLLADHMASLGVDIGPINELDESRFKNWQGEGSEEPDEEHIDGRDYSARYYSNLKNWQLADATSSETNRDISPVSRRVTSGTSTKYPANTQGNISILHESDLIGDDFSGVDQEEVIPHDHSIAEASKREEVFDDEPSSFEGSGRAAPTNLAKKRMSRMLAGRAFTAPAQLNVVTSPPTRSNPPESRHPSHPQRLPSDESSPVGSTDSFHSVQSWNSPITPLPPSPPSSRPVTPSHAQFPHPHENIIIPRPSSQGRDSQMYMASPDTDRTFVPSSAGLTDPSDEVASPLPCLPTESEGKHMSPISVDGPSKSSYTTALEGTPPQQIRPRPRPNSLSISRRALSPLPSAVNFFSPPQRQASQSRMDAVRRLPSAIIQKTVEMLLAPPTHLVNLMLKVAAKIASGEWRGLVFGFGEGGERIPVQWDYSDGEFSDWSDDEDYAMAKSKQSSSSSSIAQTALDNGLDSPRTRDSRGWEVD
ncbi:inheritance of peroxisomes protein 1-domain-containing protein [Jackrogersella minutella]|nr:inheritance of peroxisomes protein 1-domain-containing protein [Jackrogersella minutella]